MSIFESVIQEHDEKKAEMEGALADAQARKQTAQDKFEEEFTALALSVARPIFGDFVADAKKYGFPAEVEELQKGHDSVYLSLRLIPEKEAVFGPNRSLQTVFSIKGMITIQNVEYVSYYDQRPGKHGIERSSFGIRSLSQEVIERELAKFLKMAVQARIEPEKY